MAPLRPRALAVYTFVLGLLVLAPRRAPAAEPVRPGPLHVLEIDSDDADDQAEALTGALRGRVRVSPGWTLLETAQSLSMLTAALRCPPKPDATCLQHIGDQIKADRFLWGVMSRTAPHQVTAEVHLWVRGKPDSAVKETYSENLKDQNDDTVRRVASRVFDRLVGTSQGTVIVSAGNAEGAVFVDGEQKGQLDHGRASVPATVGTHVVEVRGAALNARQTVTVTAGAATEATFAAPATESVSVGTSKSSGGRKILEWGLIGGGAALVIAGGVFGIQWLGLNSDQNNNLQGVPTGQQACSVNTAAGRAACAYYNDHNSSAKLDSGLFLGLTGAGLVAAGVGIYLLVNDHGGSEASPRAGKLHVVPLVTPRSGGVGLNMAF